MMVITIDEIKAFIGLWCLAQIFIVPYTLKNFVGNKHEWISLLLFDLAALALPLFAFIGLKLIGVARWE